MLSILVAAVFAATPFYTPGPTSRPVSLHSGSGTLHVLRDHHRPTHHRGSYGPGYYGYGPGYYDNDDDIAASDVADDVQPQPIVPAVFYPNAPPMRVAEQKRTFPTYSTIVVHGEPLGNGCSFKTVMTDEEISACKRVARGELASAK
jgi:hypothetical protein